MLKNCPKGSFLFDWETSISTHDKWKKIESKNFYKKINFINFYDRTQLDLQLKETENLKQELNKSKQLAYTDNSLMQSGQIYRFIFNIITV